MDKERHRHGNRETQAWAQRDIHEYRQTQRDTDKERKRETQAWTQKDTDMDTESFGHGH